MTSPTISWGLLDELRRRLPALDARSFTPHEPTERQAEFLARGELEVMYGGAAGGGKTDALLMAALRHVHVPGYAALILRRKFTDLALPGAVMDRAAAWLQGSGAVWSDREKTWTFPSGATLTFGYCDSEQDRFRYQGAELQFVGVDELTQWPEAWYRYLLSRLRRKSGVEVPLMARSATNPGGIGHHWVKRRFVDEGGAGVFVPAKLEDNPHLDQESYRESLARLDANTRAQLEHGVWVSDGAGLVYNYSPDRNCVEHAPRCDEHVLAIDFGVVDATAFALMGWARQDRRVYVLEVRKETGLIPSEAAEIAKEYEARLKAKGGLSRIVGDVGGLGKGFAEEARRRFGVPIEPAEKQNKRGYQSLLNGALERSELLLVGPSTRLLEQEWLELPWNDARTKEAEGFDNHAADAVLYGWRACLAYLEAEPAQPADEEDEIERRLLDEARQERRAREGKYVRGKAWWEKMPC